MAILKYQLVRKMQTGQVTAAAVVHVNVRHAEEGPPPKKNTSPWCSESWVALPQRGLKLDLDMGIGRYFRSWGAFFFRGGLRRAPQVASSESSYVPPFQDHPWNLPLPLPNLILYSMFGLSGSVTHRNISLILLTPLSEIWLLQRF